MPTFNQKVGTACQSIAGLHRYQRAIVAHAQKSGWRRAGKIMRDKIELVIQRVLGDYSNWANRTLTARRGLSLARPGVGRHFVEHAIDELEAIGAAKRLSQLDCLVDGHLVGDFDMMDEFEAADQQNAMFDRRELFKRTVYIRHEALAQCGSLAQNPMQ